MEGPRDPRTYREPELNVYPPSLGDVVGVFVGCRVKTKRAPTGELELEVENGRRKHLIRV